MVFERFGKRETMLAGGLALAYLLWVTLVVCLRSDHIFFLGLCLVLFFAHPMSRKVVMALFFFAVYWIIYDSLRIYPNHAFNPVHIREPYEFDKTWFGIHLGNAVVTPNEFFAKNTHPLADVLSGLFYLCWVPVPMMFALWLFFKDKRALLDFSLAFLLVNIFGFVMYYAYPAAPPWYVELHGFEKNFHIPGNEAGLANFDRIMGVKLFNGMYAKNANVFAAIPSLHAAYPVISLYFALKKRLWKTSCLFFIILAGIWFSAVYSRHHYVLDVLLGAACAFLTILVFEKIILKSERLDGWLRRYAEAIE